MPWRVRKSDAEFFRDELWKDLRPFPGGGAPGRFIKDCFSLQNAQLEAAVLAILRARLGDELFPRPFAVHENLLELENIEGCRLFDLLRHLDRHEAIRGDGRASSAKASLLHSAGLQLSDVQQVLWEVKELFSLEAYPLESKLRKLLQLFIRVLDLDVEHLGWEANLEDFVDYWESACVQVPFRDATTKNMVVRHPVLAHTNEDGDEIQFHGVGELLEADFDWSAANIVDIDFTSIVHRTSFEDDPISLFCHEMTFSPGSIDPTRLLLHPEIAVADAYRTAATFLVRYLRFGGRKLAYRLINPQGFKVRFAFDDPLFYFREISGISTSLSGDFAADFSPLLELVTKIGEAAAHPDPEDLALLNRDALRFYFPQERFKYWQQNPTEWKG